MRKLVFLLLAGVLLSSHNLYFKMETYFLKPNQEATISLYNGTFEKSENIITRDRMENATIVAQGKRVAITANQWTDQDSTITQLSFHTGTAGTYVAGVSTKARNIGMTAAEFNDYLSHDGVVDMLQQRTDQGQLDQDAVESYQKHVKAIYQVGEAKTNDWNTVLGHPIEFVPKSNPYDNYSGEKLEVQLLLDGQPLADQLVFADYLKKGEHTHGDLSHEHSSSTHTHDGDNDPGHTHTSGQQLRTNEQGIATIDLPEDGIYYVRTIHMVTVEDRDELTHESKWATLTFEVTHKHGADTHTHEHEHEEGMSTWVFVLGSLLIIGLLFLAFRNNK